MDAVGKSPVQVTAAEAASHMKAALAAAYSQNVSYRRADPPIDSVKKAVARVGKIWLAKMSRGSISGTQLDPLGQVGVAADSITYARTTFAIRLAMPGLTLEERAYTLETAITAFADASFPDRLSTAEAYLVQLEALGDSAAIWRYNAHHLLVKTYYLLGRSADVIRHGVRAVELVNVMPYADRRAFYWQVTEEVYSPTVEALALQPHGRQQIARLSQILRAAAIPTQALLNFDSAYNQFRSSYESAANTMIAGNAQVGTLAAPLTAHYWVNRPVNDSATLRLSDGKIRVLEIGHTDCESCMWELHALQRLYERFPDVEPILYTWTFGSWANRLVEPAEEAQRLTQYFVNDVKITYPVGIWAGKKVKNEDEGMAPEPSPALKDYAFFGKPMCWIIDGHGIIRRVFTGYSYEIEQQIIKTVEFLEHEARLYDAHMSSVGTKS